MGLHSTMMSRNQFYNTRVPLLVFIRTGVNMNLYQGEKILNMSPPEVNTKLYT